MARKSADTKQAKPRKEPSPFQKWAADPGAIDTLCTEIVSGGNLYQFCLKNDFAYATISDWIAKEESRAEKYARAREDRSDLLADEIVAIADASDNDTYTDDNGVVRTNHEVVARSRLRVDSRKWVAAKLKPRVYGEKIDVTQTTTIRDETDEALLARAKRLRELLAL